jgi:hypothetical protein
MSYVPIVVSQHTLITPSLLRHIETQYDLVMQDVGSTLKQRNELLSAQILSSDPQAKEGRIYFNNVTGKIKGFSTSWQEW